MSYPEWASDVDIEHLEGPSAARMWDYYLGGSHNFAADRELAEEYMGVVPEIPYIARGVRAFLRRAVTELVGLGIDQFLDLGSGIPTAGNVHEIVHAINPDARVVYVDTDPVAYAHAARLLAGVPYADVLQADLREPADVLGSPIVTGMFDLNRPVAVLMIAVLHFVPDVDDPAAVVAAYRDGTAPGSYLAIAHATNDYRPELAPRSRPIYNRADFSMTYRSSPRIRSLMAGYDLMPPGLVNIIKWRPEAPSEIHPDPLGGDETRYAGYVAVGRRA